MGEYDQVFCITGSKGKFWHGYTHYLPALENPEETPPQPEPVIYYQNVSRDEYEQLKGKIAYVTQKIQQHLTDKKKKVRYIIK